MWLLLLNEDGISQNNCVGHDSEKLVFVCNVEVVDYLQNRIGGISNPVWLQRLNEGAGRTRNALYYSVLYGLFEFLGCPTNWEVDPFGIRQSIFSGEFPNDMIEARSKVVDDLSSDNRDTQGNWRTHKFEGIAAAFRLTLADNGISASVQESGNFTIEILDLLFGPLDLGPASIKRV